MRHSLCHKTAGRMERVPILSVQNHMQKAHKRISKGAQHFTESELFACFK